MTPLRQGARVSPRVAGYAAMGAAALTWGSLPVIVRRADAAAAVLVAMRMGFGAAALLAGHLILRRPIVPRGKLHLVIGLGAMLALSWFSFFRAISLLPGATAVLINYVFPLLVAVLAPALIREPRERHALPLAVVGFVGVCLILLPEAGAGRLAGVVFGLVAAATSGVLVIGGRYVAQHLPGPQIALWENLTGCVLLLGPALASPAPAAGAWVWGALIGVVHTALTGILFFYALRRVAAQEAGVLMYLEPVAAVLFAWLFLSATPVPSAVLGGLLVIGAGLGLVVAPASWRDPGHAPRRQAPVGEDVP